MADYQGSLSARVAAEAAEGKLDTANAPTAPAIPTAPTDDIAGIRRAVSAMKMLLDMREGRSGSVLDKGLTLRDLMNEGALVIKVGSDSYQGNSTGALLVGSGYRDPRPVLTVPPTLTALTIAGAFKSIMLSWSMLNYANHAYVEVWRTSDPSAALGTAVLNGTSTSSIYTDYSGVVGVVYYYWVRAVNIESQKGAFNSAIGTPGGLLLVGGVNLGPLVIDATKLANDAVIGRTILAGALDATKFASSIEPIGIQTGPLPTVLSTKTIFLTSDQKLYRWNGTAYVKAVDAADITVGQIQTAQLVDSAVTAVKIAAGQVTAVKTAIAAIDSASGNLTANSVASAQLVTDAVTAVKIAAGQVTAAKTAIAAIDSISGNLTANSVASAQLVTDAVTAVKIAAGQVTAAKTAIAAIDSTSGNLTANSVTAAQIVTGTIVAGKLATDSVVAANILAGAVTTAKMTAGTIDAAVLTAGSITTGLMTANSINASVIGAGTIVAGKLATDSVVAANILAGAVTTAKMTAGTIDALVLTAGSITTGLMTAGAINGDRITANTLDAGRITAGSITATQIAAGAISTAKLVVTGRGAALNDDPGFTDATAWAFSNAALTTVTDGVSGVNVARNTANTGGTIFCRPFAFNADKTYRIRAKVRRSATANGGMYLVVALSDSTGANIGRDGSYWYYPVAGIAATTAWAEITGVFGAGQGGNVFPPTARTVAAGFLANYAGTIGYYEIQDLRIEEVANFDMIVDGAIIASKMAANSITVGNGAIANLAVTNAAIANLAVDSAKIADLAVSGAKMALATITDAQIGSLNADKITAGTITAARIGVGSLDATKIDTRGLSIKDAAGNVILAAGNALDFNTRFSVGTTGMPANGATVGATAGTNLRDSGGSVLTDGAVKNSAVSISTLGVLTGAGGGQVTTLPTIDLGNGAFFGARNNNDNPSQYAVGHIKQFKTAGSIGLSGGTTYCTLETIKQYSDSSGGGVYQYAYQGTATWRRYATDPAGSTWGAWTQDLDRNVYTGALDATTNQPDATTNGAIANAGTIANWSGVANNDGNRPANGATVNQSDATTNGAIANAGTIANWSGVANNDGNRPANGATVNQSDATTNGAISGAITTASTDATNKANAAQAAAIASANAGLANKLSSSANSVLNATVSMNAVAGAGFVAGNLAWNSSGGWVSGSGVAMTPGGLVGYNSSGVAKFSIDTAGNPTFAGALSAATGTFAGSLTATAVNAVDTINIAGNAVTVPIGGVVTGAAPATSTAMSLITSVTIGAIATSAAGQGRVILWVSPATTSTDGNYRNFSQVSKAAVTGWGQLITYRWRVYRTVGGVSTVVYEKFVYDGSGSGTPTFLDFFSLLVDVPGPGVTATYSYEVSTSVPTTITNMNHEIVSLAYVLLECRK